MVSQLIRRESMSPPFSICIPFPNVEVAVVDWTSKRLVSIPPLKVEVAVEVELKYEART